MSKRFENPWPHERHGFRDVLRWKMGLGPAYVASDPSAMNGPEWRLLAVEQIKRGLSTMVWQVTWLGHASFLCVGHGVRLLIDPIFAKHCGPFPMPGLKRLYPLPFNLADLPEIDAVLLTHSHYDHCDLTALRYIGYDVAIYISEGHQKWLEKKGFTQVCEIAWWEKAQVAKNVWITATPAQHFTARTLWDRNRGHWCGWAIDGGGQRLWHAGDSGYCPGFVEIGERLGPIDFGMIPIGAYEPRWFMKSMHMNPEEAVQAFIDAKCRRAVGMHWGTFALTDEPLGEPPLRLARALQERNIPLDSFVVGAIGEQWHVG